MMELVSDFAQHGAVGFLALLAVLQASILYWLMRGSQASHDACNERVEKLINSHIEFVRQTSRDLNALAVRIEHMLDRMERVVIAARDCVEKGGESA